MLELRRRLACQVSLLYLISLASPSLLFNETAFPGWFCLAVSVGGIFDDFPEGPAAGLANLVFGGLCWFAWGRRPMISHLLLTALAINACCLIGIYQLELRGMQVLSGYWLWLLALHLLECGLLGLWIWDWQAGRLAAPVPNPAGDPVAAVEAVAAVAAVAAVEGVVVGQDRSAAPPAGNGGWLSLGSLMVIVATTCVSLALVNGLGAMGFWLSLLLLLGIGFGSSWPWLPSKGDQTCNEA
jgi:hypothetical protein